MYKHLLSWLRIAFLLLACRAIAQETTLPPPFPATKPVFQLDSPSPTADKPQSKLWYGDGSWWALLPRASGPSLWQRTASRWVEHPDVAADLAGTPGRADVWAEKGEITAVSVSPEFLSVFQVKKQQSTSTAKWKSKVLSIFKVPSHGGTFETATIARERSGRWWVAGGKVWVWQGSRSARNWHEPRALAEGLDADDICTLTELPEGIGVVWSNQAEESVKIRVHRDGSLSSDWEEEIIIESGNRTADDHLNAALSPDGTLWLATKNSRDARGEAQLVLRVRSAAGDWQNYPYSNLEADDAPSRPAVFTTADPTVVLAGHTTYHKQNPNLGKIVFGVVDTTQAGTLRHGRAVIAPDAEGWGSNNRINDITGPKKPFPPNAPWIVLASDREGRVYEVDLRQLLPARSHPTRPISPSVSPPKSSQTPPR